MFSFSARADYLDRHRKVEVGTDLKLVIGNPWNKATQQEFFDSPPATRTQATIDFINTETPFSFLFEAINRARNPWPSSLAYGIAAKCQTHTGTGVETDQQNFLDLLTCVSWAVFKYGGQLLDEGVTEAGCVTHSIGFQDTIEDLGYRGLFAGLHGASFANGTFHVINRLLFRAGDGRVYAYAHDNLNDPSALFPLNEAAIRHHDPDGDGKTDHQNFPMLALRRHKY